MRIVCQSCQGAYAIDDRLIGSRGVKAQCPKCRHQQLVKKDEPAPEEVLFQAPKPPPPVAPAVAPGAQRPNPAAAPGAGALDGLFDTPPPTASPKASSPAPGALDDLFAPPAPSARAAPATPGAGAGSFDGLFDPPPAGDRARTPGASPRAQGAVPGGSAARAQAAPSPSGSASARAPTRATPAADAGVLDELFDPPPAGDRAPPRPLLDGAATSTSASGREATRCGGCQTPLTDQFDRVLGLCESCQRAKGGAESDGLELGPPEPYASPASSGGVALGRLKPAGSTPPPEPRTPAPPRQGVVSAARPTPAEPAPRRGRRWVPVAVGAAVLVAGAGGYAWWSHQQEAARRAAAHPPLPAELAEVLPRWKLSFVDLSGPASEALALGERKLGEDTPAAYGEAEEAFQRAALLDPESDPAFEGWVLALALGRGAALDDAAFAEAEKLISAVERRSKGAPRALAAHAHLLLARPTPERLEQARALAQRSIDGAKGKDRALGHLALGRSYVESSAGLAASSFDQVLAEDPEQVRALYYRALAHAGSGRLDLATADLEQRLKQNPSQDEALAALARLYLEVGEPALARRAYQTALAAHPGDLRTSMSLAVLAYQVEGKASEGAAALRTLAKSSQSREPRERAEVSGHLAAAERAAGRLDAAEKAAKEALALAPSDPSAQLQLLLVELDRGRPTDAASRLPALESGLDDAALAALLAGKVRLAEGKAEDALSLFTQAAERDPRRLDARLLQAAAAIGLGRGDLATRALFLVATSDPRRPAPRPVTTRFYLQRQDALRGVDGVARKLAANPQDPMPRVYEAVVRFHQGDLVAADRFLGEALAIEPENALAHAWRALVGLGRGQKGRALADGALAVTGAKQLAIAHYAQGRALAADGQREPAARELRETLRLAPAFLAAEVALAALEVEAGSREAAEARLQRVTGIDPSDLEAKRALYQLERKGGVQ